MKVLKEIYPAIAMTIVLTVVLGIIYPMVVTGIAQVMFPTKAGGSLIEKGGRVIGSSLIGQPFTGAGYFHSRPSAAGSGYDATASAGSNLGPTSQKLMDNVKTAAQSLQEENPESPVPVDLVTASASGLDPHITPAAAEFQVARIARERGLSRDQVRRLVSEHTEARQFTLLGEPRVNVLELNLDLDALKPMSDATMLRSERK